MTLRVLILEDDAAKLQQIAALLVGEGATTQELLRTAPDAHSARRLLEDVHFDLLVADLSVPRALGEAARSDAGYELLDDLFEAGPPLRMPDQIIGVTGYAELAAEYTARFAEHGVLLLHYQPTGEGWQAPLVMRVRQMLAARRAVASAPEYQSALAIVCALPLELAAVRRLPWGWQEEPIAGDPGLYYVGKFKRRGVPQRVVATLCPRMGMSAAAVAATKVITAFTPRVLAMTGITAAVRGQAELGDVIVADQSWDWGMGKWTRPKPDGDVVFQPAPHQYPLDAHVRSRLAQLSEDGTTLETIRAGWPADPPATALRLKLGPVASGAAVVAAQTMTDHIRAQQRKLVGIDMEAYAVHDAVAEAVHPKPTAVVIKGVSDFADEEKGDTWQRYAAYASTAVLAHLVQELL